MAWSGAVIPVLRKVGFLVAVALLVSGLTTLAVGQGDSDRALAERILAELASPAADGGEALTGSDAEADAGVAPLVAAADAGTSVTALTAEPVLAAKRALERADSARLAKDLKQAELLEGLAREWAETARDLVIATKAEAEANQVETRAAQVGVQAERQRALLEEAIARRGRAEAELGRIAPDAGIPAPRSSAAPPKPRPAPAPAPKGSR
jgi:hypothetical protein